MKSLSSLERSLFSHLAASPSPWLGRRPSHAVGVGRSRAASMASDFPWPFPLACFACISAVHSSHRSGVLPSPMSFTTGVGSNDEDAGALVGGAHVGCS